MPIPVPTDKGLLPEGVHECSLDEIGSFFGAMEPQPHRSNLWAAFMRYLAIVKPLSLFDIIYVDGSFTTNKKTVGDIDVIFQLPIPTPALIQMMRREEFNRDFVKKNYSVHIWVRHAGNDGIFELFQGVKHEDIVRLGLTPNARKGILKVKL